MLINRKFNDRLALAYEIQASRAAAREKIPPVFLLGSQRILGVPGIVGPNQTNVTDTSAKKSADLKNTWPRIGSFRDRGRDEYKKTI